MNTLPLRTPTAQEVDQGRRWLEYLARLGYAARGIVYIIVGGLAFLAAAGQGGATTDSRGAVLTVLHNPGGWILVLVIGIGLLGHSLWRFCQAAFDADGLGHSSKAIAARIGTRPSNTWVYNWAFATAHAFLRELKAVDGVGVAVEELRRRGHRMAVASQSPLARVKLSLQVAGLAGQFGEHIYVSSMVAHPKPAPDIYLLAANRLGAVPRECIVIEDSPASAAAAQAAGMRVLGYAPGHTVAAMQSSGARVIHSMHELIAAIEA